MRTGISRRAGIGALSVALVVALGACAGPPRPPGGGRPTTTTAPTTTSTTGPSTTTTTASTTTTTTAPTTTSTTAPPVDPAGTITRLTGGDNHSMIPSVSADGRYVAFYSAATDLVPDDTNGSGDIFRLDRDTDTIARITDGNDWSRRPSISADGSRVTFDSSASNLVPDDTNGFSDIFVWDAGTGATTRITNGDDVSHNAVISADGRSVAFDSKASNLVPDDGNRFVRDVFVWNADTATTTRLTDSVWYLMEEDSGGAGISADGRYVTFSSNSSSLVPDDTNERWDVFVWDSVTDTIVRLTDGTAGGPRISSDGRYVTYSATRGIEHIFLWDATTGTTVRITPDDLDYDSSYDSTISGDGRYIAFVSAATSLVPDDTNGVPDVFVWDRDTGTTIRIGNGNEPVESAAISQDGNSVVFYTAASNLDPDDTNGMRDVFIWERPG